MQVIRNSDRRETRLQEMPPAYLYTDGNSTKQFSKVAPEIVEEHLSNLPPLIDLFIGNKNLFFFLSLFSINSPSRSYLNLQAEWLIIYLT
jgi:hypothetical protein